MLDQVEVFLAPRDHVHLRLLLSLAYREMHRAILRVYPRHESWLLDRFLICAAIAMPHGRPLLFFKHVHVYPIDGVLPANLFFVRNLLFCISAFLLKRVGDEVFRWGIDRAWFLPWLLGLALFVRFLPVHRFPLADSLLHFLSPLVFLCLFLARHTIRWTKLDCSSRISFSLVEAHA